MVSSPCFESIKRCLSVVVPVKASSEATSSQDLMRSRNDAGKEMLQGEIMGCNEFHEDKDASLIMEGRDNENDSSSSASSLGEESRGSSGSTSSSDMVDDASSSSPTGPLYGLSDLMAQLPIKRGLSKFYDGKCQSYTSLARVTSVEDLAKKESPYRRKLKACKSYGGGLDAHKPYTLPKATISKKASRGSMPSLSCSSKRGSFLGISRPPPVPVQKNF